MSTYYRLIKNGKQFFENGNTACFAEIFEYGNWNISKMKDWKDITIEFCTDPFIEFEDVLKFVKRCKPWGIKASAKRIDLEELESWHDEAPDFARKNPCKIIIKFSDYENVNYVKFAIHVLRSLIEDANIVKAFVDAKLPQGIQYWQLFRIKASLVHNDGHGYFAGLARHNYTGDVSFHQNPKFSTVREKIPTQGFHNVTQGAVYSEPLKRCRMESHLIEEELITQAREYNRTNK